MKKITIELLATLGIQIVPFIFIINGAINRNGLGINNGDGLLLLGVILLALIGIIYVFTYGLNIIIIGYEQRPIPKYKYFLLAYWVLVIISIYLYLKSRNFF
ncbi:hypothetical protein ACVQ8P_05460 [Dellaglioa sp. BT-FLS60]